ncbi:MAG: type III-A CRISPR-associated RAMP protein Csm3 [Phycisphaerae bacterium]|jgi:CRISPR-associated protein Csm3
MKKVNHYVIRGEIELLSGMRIGGSDDVLQIGGTDLTCIRDPVTGRPYIPGSSLKGKMRCSLEKALGRYYRAKSERDKRFEGREPCNCAAQDCPVCRMFGPHKAPDHSLGPSRIIVRDAPLIADSFAIENKSSTAIDRSTGTALGGALRTEERVAPGAKFRLEIGVQEFDIDKDFTYTDAHEKAVKGADALLEVVCHCLDLIEQTGIGAGTGKGYGQVRIEIEREQKLGRRDRRGGTSPGPSGEPQT